MQNPFSVLSSMDPLSHQQTTLERISSMVCSGVYFCLALVGAMTVGALGFLWYGDIFS